MKTGFKKALGIIILALLVIFGAWYAFRSRRSENPVPPVQNSAAADIAIDFGRGSVTQISDLNVPADATAFSLTREAAENNGLVFESREYPGMGSLVTRIGDRKNGDGKAYWQFWVNGKYSDKAADQVKIAGGDKIEWKFTSSTQQ